MSLGNGILRSSSLAIVPGTRKYLGKKPQCCLDRFMRVDIRGHFLSFHEFSGKQIKKNPKLPFLIHGVCRGKVASLSTNWNYAASDQAKWIPEQIGSVRNDHLAFFCTLVSLH